MESEHAQRTPGDESKKGTQTTMRQHACDSATTLKVLFWLAMFFFTTFTSARRIENPFLKMAFAARGVNLPDRKELMSKHLDLCYGFYRDDWLSQLRKYNGVYQITTDGWKKRGADKGVHQST